MAMKTRKMPQHLHELCLAGVTVKQYHDGIEALWELRISAGWCRKRKRWFIQKTFDGAKPGECCCITGYLDLADWLPLLRDPQAALARLAEV